MTCVRCRRPVQPGARWCSFCGEPVQPVTGETQPLPPPLEQPYYEEASPAVGVGRDPAASGAAIAALVLAIIGLVGPLPFLGSLLALGFASRARREAAYGVAGGEQIARAARIIAWTGIILVLIAAAIVGGLLLWAAQSDNGFTFR